MKIIIIGIVVTIVGLFLMSSLDKYVNPDTSLNGQPTTEVVGENTVKIDISGEVNHPGEYLMYTDNTLGQLLEKAGGATENADDSAYDPSLEIGKRTSFYIPPLFKAPDICAEQTFVKVNVNIAPENELTEIGFNDAQASNLVVYRRTIATFKAIEDILDVKGIGQATFEKVKNKICIS
jgi:competence protein comEA helix-hairpin-helix repeat protein